MPMVACARLEYHSMGPLTHNRCVGRQAAEVRARAEIAGTQGGFKAIEGQWYWEHDSILCIPHLHYNY